MKAYATTTAPALETRALELRSRLQDYAELFKLRLNSLVLIATAIGYLFGAARPLQFWTLLHAMLGTAMVAFAGCALNQLYERHTDAQMPRTCTRPLPAGRIQPAEAFWVGTLLGLGALLYLALAVSPLCALVAGTTLFSYVLVYTPLKQHTPMAVYVGAVPGALPPMIGWVAARGEIGGDGWILFALQFAWQIPHFLSIAWIYRKDYARAGYQVLAVVDPDGRRTGRHAVLWSLLLLPISALPALRGLTGLTYLIGALVLGALYVHASLNLALRPSEERARRVFRVSLVYLPLVLALLVFDLQPR